MRFRLIVITAPDASKNETAQIHELFRAGLKTLHIRKPGYSKDQLRNFIADIDRKYHRRLTIHSHYSLAREFDLGGIHLTERTRRHKLPTAYKRNLHRLSASFHSMEDIRRSRRKYTYVLLSPIFESISKHGYKSSFDRDRLLTFLNSHRRVVALGGILPSVIKEIVRMKFAGAASLGFIWQEKNPVTAFKKFYSKVQ